MPGANKLREDLIPPTLKNASGMPFYAALWQGIHLDDVRTPADLARLPAVTKGLYRKSFMFDGSALKDSAFITHTTGTTGEVTWRHRSVNEAAVINKLFGLVDGQSNAPRLGLVVQYGRHGMAMPMPGNIRTFPIALSDDTELDQALCALAAAFHFSDGVLRPSLLVGGVQHLALLAQAWSERPASKTQRLSIQSLQVLGYTDPGLYSFLMDVFEQPVLHENFSMAEVFGSATRRWPSSSFLLDPHVVGEVVDEDSRPVSPGAVGELVLTELFPFVQMQPLIRYRTGDIVRLTANDDEAGFQFEWWGRRRDCIPLAENNRRIWALGYRPIADWLSEQPLAARESRSAHLNVRSCDFGPPCLRISWDERVSCIDLEIGVRTNPLSSRTAITAFVAALWRKLNEQALGEAARLRLRLALTHVAAPVTDFNACTLPHQLIMTPCMIGGPPPTGSE